MVICKDSIGGVKSLFLSPFVKFPRRLFLSDAMTFPTVERVDAIFMPGASFNENLNSDEGFDQTLNFSLLKLQSDEFKPRLLKNEWRAIAEDYNGSYWILGAMNGLRLTGHEGTSANNKNEFTGYNFTLTGQEEYEIFKITDLTPFIIDGVLFLASSEVESSTENLASQLYI